MTAPYVYIASLSDYNNGTLHGVWIFADQEADDIQEEISEMLAASADPGAEEWATNSCMPLSWIMSTSGRETS